MINLDLQNLKYVRQIERTFQVSLAMLQWHLAAYVVVTQQQARSHGDDTPVITQLKTITCIE